MQLGLFFDPKYDLERWEDDTYRYKRKLAPTTVHHFVRSLPLEAGTRILDVGGGDGRAVARDFTGAGCFVTCMDQVVPAVPQASEHLAVDLDEPWVAQVGESQYDVCFVLDIIEHLKRPEQRMEDIRRKLKNGGLLYASTGNIGFFPLRLMLLSGFFNYGRKGILDRTHTRLFTVSSFRRLLRQGGFQVLKVHGFGPPIRDLVGAQSAVLKLLDTFLFRLARLWPRLFAYQILVVARKVPDLRSLVDETTSFVARSNPPTSTSESLRQQIAQR
jgi:SAM-dependent methyltransferase